MNQRPAIPRVYDLAAMRGWRMVRLDRTLAPASQCNKRFAQAAVQLPKAA